MKNDTKAKLVLAAASTLLAIYGAEVLLTSLTPGEFPEIAKRKGIELDPRSVSAVTLDLRENGVDAYPYVTPHHWFRDAPNGLGPDGSVFPLSGVSKVTTVFCNTNETGEYVLYPSDEHGFNNPPDSWAHETVDVVVIGDSFAQGYCVGPGSDVASRLRDGGRTAINLGVNGTGPLVQLAVLKEYAAPLAPGEVFWLFFEGNDLPNLADEASIALLRNYLGDFTQRLVDRQAEIDTALRNYVDSRLDSRTAERKTKSWAERAKEIVKLTSLRTRLGFTKWVSPPDDPMFPEILKEAKRTVAEWGGRLHFIYIPHYGRFKTRKADAPLYGKDFVLSAVADAGIPVVDLTGPIRALPDPLSVFPLGETIHLNAAGYALTADMISDHLAQTVD